MMRKKYLYDMVGEIFEMYVNETAVIRFDSDGTEDYALLKKSRFYHDGRLIPENVQLSKYIRQKTKVKFSCHILAHSDQENLDIRHYRPCRWYAIICWIDEDHLSDNKVSMSLGLFSASCGVENVRNRRGILTVENMDEDHRIDFLASKFYIQSKRLSSSKMLSSVLNKNDKVFCDAVPCIKEASRDNCSWFATCVFQGKRPYLLQALDTVNIFYAYDSTQINQNLVDQGSQVLNENYDDGTNEKLQQPPMRISLKSQLLEVIRLYTSEPRFVFTRGHGFVFHLLDDEFAIVLGCFKLNLFRTILFHRRNAFLFKSSLAGSKLSEIFVEGDHVRFIAVGAPPNFITDYIAVQVSVCEMTSEIENTSGSEDSSDT